MKNLYLILIFFSVAVFVDAQWVQRNALQTSYIDNVSVVNQNVIWLTDQTNLSVSISTDDGQTWVNRPYTELFDGCTLGSFSAVSETTAYIVAAGAYAETVSKTGLYKTTDGGISWTKVSNVFSSSSFPNFVYFWNENEGLTMGDAYPNENFELYTTSDAGQTWEPVPSGQMPSGNSEWGLNSSSHVVVRNETIYFTTSGGRLFKSNDKGHNWTVINTPATSNSYLSADFKNDNQGMVVISDATNNDYRVYTTDNGGTTWDQQDGDYWFLKRIKYDPVHEVYFSTSSLYGLAYSADNGKTWTRHPSFINLAVGSVNVLPDHKIFIGGWGYAFISDNYTGVNPTVTMAESQDDNKINIYFSDAVDENSVGSTANYLVTYRQPDDLGANVLDTIELSEAALDPSNHNKVILTTTTSVPYDTITVRTYNIVSEAGLQVLFNSAVSRYSFEKTEATSIQQEKVDEVVRFYPNPVRDVIYIDVDSSVKSVSVIIANMLGQEIKSFSTNNVGHIPFSLNMDNGLYYLIVKGDQGSQLLSINKFIKVN
ncbi:MAG: T9SS type A sorting domain-containing protein [Paludibacter sp.]|nr:T9SS type A sorting domain-containing protein [Paludibacter sp.]